MHEEFGDGNSRKHFLGGGKKRTIRNSKHTGSRGGRMEAEGTDAEEVGMETEGTDAVEAVVKFEGTGSEEMGSTASEASGTDADHRNTAQKIAKAMETLAEEFGRLDFTFHHYHEDGHDYLKNLWPGGDDESVMVCVYRGDSIHEPFHRHDFIYLNYAYKNDYAALSDREGNLVTVHEGECYIGQPFSGYALRSIEGVESTIIGVLIKKEVFFRSFLQTFASDDMLFHFFLDPEKEKYADKYLHFSFRNEPGVRPLLEMMVLEYANRTSDSQQILTSMAMTLYLLVARAYHRDAELSTNAQGSGEEAPVREILSYIDSHFRSVSLKELSGRFAYHPNYISGMLHKETGKTFSEILLEKRMEHALVLMKGTDLSNEEIADALGYTSTTNYYKAFRRYYGMTPREYAAKYRFGKDSGKEYPLARSHR